MGGYGAVNRRRRDECLRWCRTNRIDFYVAGRGRIITRHFLFDRCAGLVNIDIQVDHVGLVGAVGFFRIGSRHHFAERFGGHSLNSVNFGRIVLVAGGRVEAGTVGLGGAKGMTAAPRKAIGLGQIDLPFAGVPVTKCNATGRICLHGWFAFIGALVVADVIAAYGQPIAGLVQFIAHHARFMWLGKGCLELHSGVSDGTAFGDEHDVLLCALRERNIGNGMAVPNLCNALCINLEVRQEEFSPDG